MFGWFKKNPEQKLQREIDRKQAEAMQMQRNGKIREFAELTREIEELEEQLLAMGAASK